MCISRRSGSLRQDGGRATRGGHTRNRKAEGWQSNAHQRIYGQREQEEASHGAREPFTSRLLTMQSLSLLSSETDWNSAG